MVIIGNKCGQLCNRLFLFSHFIANSIEHEYELINPYFGEYRNLFLSTDKNDFGAYKISVKYKSCHELYSKLGQYLIPTMGRLIRSSPLHHFEFIDYTYDRENKIFHLNNEDFVNKAISKKIVITYGWLFRDYKNFNKHAEKIRAFFRPKDESMQKIEMLISESKQCADILVGVHLRRGDYKTFEEGKYLFNDSVYLDKMLQLKLILEKEGKRTSFLLCSNEEINRNSFDNINMNLANGQVIEDLYSLARCDYIIGPPSTFSMWASFYGKTPLLHIRDEKQMMDLENFKINCG